LRAACAARVPATLLTILASFAYALFTGFATPVQRSLWMVTLYLLGRLLYRERNPLNTIGFAALCLLAFSPRSLFDASFQMTLLAVVAIAGVAAPLLQGTVHPLPDGHARPAPHRHRRKLAPRLAQFRVTLRMIAARMQGAGCSAASPGASFPGRCASDPLLRADGRLLRGGAGHGPAHGHLLPPHHRLRAAGECLHPAAAFPRRSSGNQAAFCALLAAAIAAGAKWFPWLRGARRGRHLCSPRWPPFCQSPSITLATRCWSRPSTWARAIPCC
jgi:hypothetical protein